MPAVWDLLCPKRVRSRRALFQEGVEALRRDEGVRRVACSKTSTSLCARVTFWNDGPVDGALANLRDEFSLTNVNRPVPRPLTSGYTQPLPSAPTNEESRLMEAFGSGMEIVRSHAQRAGRSLLLSQAENSAYFARYLSSPEGRSHLARTLTAPLRRAMDTAGLARRVFPVEQLPPVPAGRLYMASEPEFVGRIPVRTEIDLPPRELVTDQTMSMPIGPFWTPSVDALELPNVAVPTWCVPGAWLYDQSTGRFAIVRVLLRCNRAGVRFWFRGALRRRLQYVTGKDLHHHWNPCDGPKMPREVWWEDLLRDDFADL